MQTIGQTNTQKTGGADISCSTYDNVNVHRLRPSLSQREVKAQATIGAIGSGNGASVKLYGVLHDRESEPRTPLLARTALVDPIETLKQSGELLLFHPAAIVFEAYAALPLVVRGKCDVDITPA